MNRGNIWAFHSAPQIGIDVAGRYYIVSSVDLQGFGSGVLRLSEDSSWSGVTF